jgi:hypothetical protein
VDEDVKQILLDGFRDVRKEVADLRADMSAVKAISQEIKDSRSQLRDELAVAIGRIDGRFGGHSGRITDLEKDSNEKRGRDRVLVWFGTGGGLAGVASAIKAFLLNTN